MVRVARLELLTKRVFSTENQQLCSEVCSKAFLHLLSGLGNHVGADVCIDVERR